MYYNEERTLKEIAKKVGMDRHTIGKIFKEQGWETRRTAAIRQMKSLETSIATSEKQSKRIVSSKKVKKKRKNINPLDVYRLYFIEDLSLKETAKRLGVKTTGPINQILKEQGWETKPRGKVIDIRETYQMYFRESKSLIEISKLLGVSSGYLKTRFAEQGWKLRPSEKDLDLDRAYRLYFDDCLSFEEVAKILGVSAGMISDRFKQQGWKSRYVPSSKDIPDIDSVYQLYYEKGLTKEEIAEKLNASESAIRKIFREMGWPSKIRKFETEEERALAIKEKKRETSQKLKEIREEKFGNECRICGEKRMLAIHKKDGEEHDPNLLWRMYFLESANPDEWAALGVPCHRGVHWMMESFGYEWDQLETLGLSAQKSPPEELEPLELPSDDAPSSAEYIELKKKFNGSSEELRSTLFGDTCFFCGMQKESGKKTPLHRKDGRPHDNRLTNNEKYFRTLNPDEWVTLCQKHHRLVHWAMDKLGLEWDDFETDLEKK